MDALHLACVERDELRRKIRAIALAIDPNYSDGGDVEVYARCLYENPIDAMNKLAALTASLASALPDLSRVAEENNRISRCLQYPINIAPTANMLNPATMILTLGNPTWRKIK